MDFVSAVRHRLSLVVVCWSFVLTTAQKKRPLKAVFFGAGSETRTHMVSLPTDFESHQAIGISKYLLETNRVLCTDKYDEIGLFAALCKKIGQKNGITFLCIR